MNLYYCPSRRGPGTQPRLTDPVNGGTGDCLQGNCSSGGIVPGALGDYAACMGSSGLDYTGTTSVPGKGAFIYYTLGGRRFQDITDGLSTTLLVGEKHVRPGEFGRQYDTSIYNGDNGGATRDAGPGIALAQGPTTPASARFGSWHPGVCQFVFGDGSVQALPVSINTTVLGNLADVSDGSANTNW